MKNLSASFVSRCAYNNTKPNPISARKAAQLCERNWDGDYFATCARGLYPAATPFYISKITGVPPRTNERHLDGFNPCANHLLRYLNAGDLGVMLLGAFINPDLLQAACINADLETDLKNGGAYASFKQTACGASGKDSCQNP